MGGHHWSKKLRAANNVELADELDRLQNLLDRRNMEALDYIVQRIQWRTALIKYMSHVGDCEGVFFTTADDAEDYGLTESEWSEVIKLAGTLENK